MTVTTLPEDGLPCPLCGYDLRGLPPGRCPECGHLFDPLELRAAQEARQRDRDNRPLPWLVEYASARTRTGWLSPILTPLASAVPWWFWRTLRPHMPVRAVRLVVYGLATFAAALVVLCLATAAETSLYAWVDARFAPSGTITLAGGTVVPAATVPPRYEQDDPNPLDNLGHRHRELLLLLVVWPPLTLVCLLSLRASLRLARIDRRHVWRCAIYSGDAMLLAGPTLLLADVLTAFGWVPLSAKELPLVPDAFLFTAAPTMLACVMLIGLFWLRLTVAYRQYLRFRHAAATVAATQVILILLALLLQCLVLVW